MVKSTKEVLKDAFYDSTVPLPEAEDDVMAKLINLEGHASWVPSFVFWLFEKYDIKRKN